MTDKTEREVNGMKSIDGRVIKQISSVFFVETQNGVFKCFARKKIKKQLDGGNILVGDYVEICSERNEYVIERLLPRKNCLVRPYISNIDVCFIVIAPVPEPDFMLVDKIIVNCLEQSIKPVLVLNKSDIGQVDVSEYRHIIDIVECSASDSSNLTELVKIAKGKTVCFAGQSAVGKSSLINAVLDSNLLETGELAKKIKRGKNTTRKIEIIDIGNGTYLADTCGFSMLETVDIPPEELRLYFDDLEEFRPFCRFNTCTHIDEPDCACKPHIGKEIGSGRYSRYKAIFEELVARKQSKYD